MISFDEKTRTFRLDTPNTTYAFALTDSVPEHLFYGSKIAGDDLRGFWYPSNVCHDAHIGDCPSQSMILAELPTYGRGDYREPAVLFRRDGKLSCDLTFRGYRITRENRVPGLPSLFGGETLEVTYADDSAGIEIVSCYTVFDDTDAIGRRTVYRNTGKAPLTLDRAYSFAFDLPHSDLDMISLHGAWANECNPERIPLAHRVQKVSSRRGASSGVNNPFIACVSHDATEMYGDAFGVSLIYASSFDLVAECGQNGTTRITGGVSDFGFTWTLEPGASFHTPEAVIAYSREGLGGLSRAYHDAFRAHLIRPEYRDTPRPIVINSWEAMYFNFTEESLIRMIRSVKGTGIDTFVLDDGWFGKRRNDRAGLGDWYVSEEVLPHGLTPVINACHENGMKFGLWFEPEMVNPDSDLYRAHPDYAIHAPGYPLPESRHQYVLDLTRREVRDYIVSSVNKKLDGNDISYVKWDFNRNLTDFFSEGLPEERQGEFAHRYALGLYELFDRIVLAHPNVFFEGCASGGSRFDPSILAYFPQIWTSDDTDAAMRTRIQWGTSLVYPLSAMSCHVSVCPNQMTGRTIPFASRVAIAHLGATGYELDPSEMTPEEIADLPREVAEYRAMEPIVMSGDFYRLHSPFDGRWYASEIVSRDKKEALVTVMRLSLLVNDESIRIPLAGLDPDTLYDVNDGAFRLHGNTLMAIGVPYRYTSLCEYGSVVFRLRAL